MSRFIVPIGIVVIGILTGMGLHQVAQATKHRVDTTPYCITVKHTFTYTSSGVDASGKTVMYRDVARKGDMLCRPRR